MIMQQADERPPEQKENNGTYMFQTTQSNRVTVIEQYCQIG